MEEDYVVAYIIKLPQNLFEENKEKWENYRQDIQSLAGICDVCP
jgi:hypothetical protein